MRIIIAGSRNIPFNKCKAILSHLDTIITQRAYGRDLSKTVILSGCARGGDLLGESFAKARGFTIERYPAEWNKYGRGAGHRRNAEMAKVADGLIAIWDGQSLGTKGMIARAQKLGLWVEVIRL